MTMTLSIEFVSDFTCPWCFIGKARLARALEELRATRPELEISMHALPFFLNPGTPEAGRPYRAFLEEKFGSAREADAVLARVTEAGAADGIPFAFGRIATLPDTLRAHTLSYRAQARGDTPERAARLADGLFRAHFEEGRDIGDNATLADIAAGAGDRREAVLDYLERGEGIAAVNKMAAQVRELGISSVPFFIFNRKLTVSGAQSPAVLGAAMLRALG